MKLSELRPCDACGGVIAPQFYVLKLSLAIIDAREANNTLGLTQMFGGALGLAEAMSPTPNAVKIAGEHDARLWDTLFLCRDCVLLKEDLDLGQLLAKRQDELEAEQRSGT